MSKYDFEIGDAVLIVPDEGLDTPREARGKTGRVTGYVYHEGVVVEFLVQGTGFAEFNFAGYHLLKLPSLRMYDDAKNIMGILHANDPDLHERVHEISKEHYRLRDFSDATTCFVLMWLGVHKITEDPRALEGSGIHEMVK